MRTRITAAFVALFGMTACSSGSSSSSGSEGGQVGADNSSADRQSGSTGGADAKVMNVNPCTLLTDDEIATQVDLTYEPSQRAGMHQLNVKHQISKEEDRTGMGPACHISWHSVTPTGDERAKGTFDVKVMTADQLKMFEGMSRPKTGARASGIPGVGDEAFYLEHAPSARVGDIAVSITEFPDTHQGNGGVELLRAAAGRLR